MPQVKSDADLFGGMETEQRGENTTVAVIDGFRAANGKTEMRARERIESLSQRDRDELGTTTTNRHIVSGEEVFAGTRIPVTTIVYAIRDGWSDGEILENYPRLTETDIKLARDRSTNSSLVPAG